MKKKKNNSRLQFLKEVVVRLNSPQQSKLIGKGKAIPTDSNGTNCHEETWGGTTTNG
jgi:hypothetical protein